MSTMADSRPLTLLLSFLFVACLAWAIAMTVLWSNERSNTNDTTQKAGWYPQLPTLNEIVASVEDPGLVNGEVPPGEVLAANSSLISMDYEHGLYFATWLISRPPGYRAPVHIHARPVWMCLKVGCVRVYLEGSEPKEFCAGDCWWSPSMTKMAVLTIGNETKEEWDMFILDQDETPSNHIPDWVITEPDYTNMDVFGM